MRVKTKIRILFLLFVFRNWRAKRIAKKIRKQKKSDKFTDAWRQKLLLKRSKQYAKLFRVNLKVTGYDNLPKAPTILAPNHSSSFDPALLMMALENPRKGEDYPNPSFVFLAKVELKGQKFFGGYMDIINTFYINRQKPRQALETLKNFVEYAKKGKHHGIVFPEGTRSKDGKVAEFKGGAFKVAKRDFFTIVPVTINNAFAITDFSRRKWMDVEVIFHPPIKPLSIIEQNAKTIAKKVELIVRKGWKKGADERKRAEERF